MIVSEERAVMLVGGEGDEKSAKGGVEAGFVEPMDRRVRYEEVGDPAMLPAA